MQKISTMLEHNTSISILLLRSTMKLIQKIIAPTNQHHDEYLTMWIADLEEGKQIWIQTSKDQDKPKWERLGFLYEELVLEEQAYQENMLNDVQLLFPKRLKE